MLVRSARPGDLAQLEALRLRMSYPGSHFYDEETFYQTALQRLRDCLPRLDELQDWRVLVLEDEEVARGYLLFVVDHQHGVTQQLEAHLLDYAVFDFEALQTLTARARKIVNAFENEVLVVEVAATDQRRQLWFYRCGFRPEQQRVVKRIPRGHRGASSPDYRLRPARAEDMPFILEIHSANSQVYLPAGRRVDPDEVELRYQLTYLAMDLDSSGASRYLIMEEVASGSPAGYVFIKEGPVYGGEPSFYIYDAAIAPAFAGRGLSRYLRGAAETLAGEKGALVYGDGSLATPVIASWHQQMGYAVDSLVFALSCGC